MKLLKFTIVIGLLFTSLIACNSPYLSFKDIVPNENEIVEIKARNYEGYFYTVTSEEKINDFFKLFHETSFIETEEIVVFGGTALQLVDRDGVEITNILQVDKNVFRIGDSYYKTTSDIDKEVNDYLKEHFKKDNLVVEEGMSVNLNADNIKKVTIKDLKKNVSKVIDKRGSISSIVNVFNATRKQEGIVNMAKPHYAMNFGTASYYVWIDGENLTLQDTKNSHTIFSLATSEVKDIDVLFTEIFQ
jgi:hypothetical protein